MQGPEKLDIYNEHEISGLNTTDKFSNYQQSFPTGSSSSTDELTQALSSLSGYATDKHFRMTDTSGTGLSNAGYYAATIAEKFVGVNESVTKGWDNVAKFTSSMDKMLAETMQKFTNELRLFIETTQEHEQEAQQAVIKANEAAEQILSSLQQTFSSLDNK